MRLGRQGANRFPLVNPFGMWAANSCSLAPFCITKITIEMFPQLAQFTDVALLLLRIMVGLVFITSGWNHLKDPEARSKDIGMSKGFTIFLGAAEVAGSLGIVFWRSHATGRGGFDIAHARRNSEKDCMAHRLLGRLRNKRMELRHDACRDESSDRHYRRWESLRFEMICSARAA